MKDEGNGGNGNVSEVKSNKSMVKKVIVGVVVVLIIYFLSGIRVVQPTQVAVVERFSYVVGVKSAGINYGLRFIDKFVFFVVFFTIISLLLP